MSGSEVRGEPVASYGNSSVVALSGPCYGRIDEPREDGTDRCHYTGRWTLVQQDRTIHFCDRHVPTRWETLEHKAKAALTPLFVDKHNAECDAMCNYPNPTPTDYEGDSNGCVYEPHLATVTEFGEVTMFCRTHARPSWLRALDELEEGDGRSE